MTLQPYPAYKDFGVPWLGAVPAHWTVLPGRACYSQKHVANVGLKETTVLSLSYGQIVVKSADKLHGLVPDSYATYQIVEPGDIIIRPTDLQNDWNSLRFGLSHNQGIITSAYMCLRTRGLMTREYGHLLLHTYDLKKVFYGLGSGLRQNLDWRDLKYLTCLVPPLVEQSAIVRFLDHTDRRVRRYIRAKKKLIALLNEQKQAIINQAVTRGLDAKVRMKVSGIAWLPEIPTHWMSMRAGDLAESLQTGPFGSQLHAQDYEPGGIPVINPSHMKQGRIVADQNIAVGPEKAGELARHSLLTGDIVFARRGELGRCALVGTRETGWLCGTGSLRMRLLSQVGDPQYLLRLFLSKPVAEWLSLQSVGSTMENLNTGILARLPLPLPPKHEQLAIVAWLQVRTANLDLTTSKTAQEIVLLKEYHTGLIADVVTGKLDVRAEAARLPEDTDEPEPLHNAEALTEIDVDDDLEQALVAEAEG